MTATTNCPRCWGARVERGTIVTPTPCRRCGGLGEVPFAAVSPHFSVDEVWGQPHSMSLGATPISNDPDPIQTEDARLLAIELLEPARAGLGGHPWRVNSWFRAPVLDAFVAQDDRWLTHLSAHAIGAAADVRPLLPDLAMVPALKALMDWYRTSPVHWDQLILEFGCLHVGRRAPVPGLVQRMQCLVRVHGHDGRAAYEAYDGTASQLARAT